MQARINCGEEVIAGEWMGGEATGHRSHQYMGPSDPITASASPRVPNEPCSPWMQRSSNRTREKSLMRYLWILRYMAYVIRYNQTRMTRDSFQSYLSASTVNIRCGLFAQNVYRREFSLPSRFSRSLASCSSLKQPIRFRMSFLSPRFRLEEKPLLFLLLVRSELLLL